MVSSEVEKSKSHILIEIIDYVPNAVVSKTIIRKTTGNITVIAIDTGELIEDKISPFDTFIQVIEGTAHVIIESKLNVLNAGQGIVIPAHNSNAIESDKRFKIISTVIKSGYSEAII